jgi:hypothetical protein
MALNTDGCKRIARPKYMFVSDIRNFFLPNASSKLPKRDRAAATQAKKD